MMPGFPSRSGVVYLLVLLCLGLAPRPLYARAVQLESLEWRTDQAEIVIDATVAELRPAPPIGGIRPDGSHLLRLNAGVSLKGEPRTALDVVHVGPPPRPGERVIAFVRVVQVPSVCGPDPATGKVSMSGEGRVLYLLGAGGEAWQVPDRRFGFVDGRAQVVEAIRRRRNVRHAGYALLVPVPQHTPLGRSYGGASGGAAGGAGTPGRRLPGVLLAVPVDDETERYALELMGSSLAGERATGVSLLRAFESTENIERLLGLLDTPVAAGASADPVRAAVLETLKYWRVPVQGEAWRSVPEKPGAAPRSPVPAGHPGAR